ncbi:hypothetical protein DTO271G3_1598 [Paecilomyces variotii]|nr:hypothetical protein DTO271G3_1598 [Paecilomyces variotii]
MAPSIMKLATLVANLLVLIAMVIFATGFFPYKPLLQGHASFDDSRQFRRPPQIYNKLIFMVVDALRSDFVYSDASGFSFTQSLIRSGVALPFTAHASPPTVTMPRLKAITTGSVPSFLDVILNIAESDTTSSLANQDTWLSQLKAKSEGRLVMYGDDTWLKLFPGMFDRADGTTSFFVSDFTEVDNNVTRHIPDELARDDWSTLVMHYLGLDHIGHKAGPKSPNMLPKQHEMDDIVKEIYTAIDTHEHLQSTLLVLCGDHGMNDAGNHGGSSAGETSAALVFMSPKFAPKQFENASPLEAVEDFQYYRRVEQSDITPTLAGLLGIPISTNNLGVFIPELLTMWDDVSERVQLLLENCSQMLGIVKAAFPNRAFDNTPPLHRCDSKVSDIEELECAWHQISDMLMASDGRNDTLAEIESHLFRFSYMAQELMSHAASNYDLSRLYKGLLLSGMAVLLSLPAIFTPLSKASRTGIFLTLSIAGYCSMMFASSYVEEEQQFWYWVATGWIFYLHIRSARSDAVGSQFPRMHAIALMLTYRLMRRWNQTGQKFSAEPDIARNFLPSHPTLLWALVLLTYFDSCRRMISAFSGSRFAVIKSSISLILTCLALTFKLSFTAADSPALLDHPLLSKFANTVASSISLIMQARLVFFGIALVILCTVSERTKRRPGNTRERIILHEALSLLLITQSRATNIPLFLVLRVQKSILETMDLTGLEITIISLISQYVSFFAFGGSNAISSVDLSSAYNGVGNYNILLVGFLTFMSNWAGPVWWVSATHLIHPRWGNVDRQNHLAVLTFHSTMMLLSVMAACTVLRTHLFIWTVFSPKFLYTAAWVAAHHIVINVLGESLALLCI